MSLDFTGMSSWYSNISTICSPPRIFRTRVIGQARRDITEREEMLQRERQSAVVKVQRESSLEKAKLDKEVARLREDKLKLDGLNREMNDRGSLVRRPVWQWLPLHLDLAWFDIYLILAWLGRFIDLACETLLGFPVLTPLSGSIIDELIILHPMFRITPSKCSQRRVAVVRTVHTNFSVSLLQHILPWPFQLATRFVGQGDHVHVPVLIFS